MTITLAGVSAVVFRGEDVLLVRRIRKPFAGLWSLPGGRIEAGETPAEAVVREMREETGLAVVPAGRTLPHPLPDGRVVLVHAVHLHGGDLHAGDDAAEVRWVRIGAVAALRHTPGLPAVVAAFADDAAGALESGP